MSKPTTPAPCVLLIGLLAQREAWLAAAERHLVGLFGPIDLASDLLPFTFTDYYDTDMGRGLLRKFLTFQRLVAPDTLAATKLATNALEDRLAAELDAPVPRPVNLDPGLLDGSKLVLASTKDQAHRIYLADGIYAEITLTYRKGRFVPCPWTYPDYRTEPYHAFFAKARARLPALRRSSP